MTSATSTAQNYSVPNELIPAEAAARLKRSSGFPMPRVFGGTVDQEGLANNYAVGPKSSAAEKTSGKTRLWQAVAFAAATWIPVSIAILVS
ncbi:MAG: hypothetical protein AAF329_21960 [Cyanobacteria bacterium P01_A01_bin.17]